MSHVQHSHQFTSWHLELSQLFRNLEVLATKRRERVEDRHAIENSTGLAIGATLGRFGQVVAGGLLGNREVWNDLCTKTP